MPMLIGAETLTPADPYRAFYTNSRAQVSAGAAKCNPQSLSTTKAKYQVLTNAAKDIIHLQRLFQKLGFNMDAPTILLSDNQSCIRLVDNPVLHTRAKHIEFQHHFIRDTAKVGEIQVGYIFTKD